MSGELCECTEDQLLAFVAGDLEVAEELEVAEHLGECEECCEQAADFRALSLALPDCGCDDAIRWHSFETPFGTMYVAATSAGLVRVSWQQPGPDAFAKQLERRFPGRPVIRDPNALGEAERELREYFAGQRACFDLPVDLSSLSEFEQRVLEAARRIPPGEVVCYSELARRIGKPKAARAVGNALGHNPVAIVVPCHRIVRRDGSLGGYGGGVEYKKRLLTIEGAHLLAS
ncbi:MAG: methylated-DNA--[protein]-cysteine S-methyltransferase [Gemmatimonadota bacterium]